MSGFWRRKLWCSLMPRLISSYRNESECEPRFGRQYMACNVADVSCCSGLTFADSLAVFVMRASECLRTSFICLISVSRSPGVPE